MPLWTTVSFGFYTNMRIERTMRVWNPYFPEPKTEEEREQEAINMAREDIRRFLAEESETAGGPQDRAADVANLESEYDAMQMLEDLASDYGDDCGHDNDSDHHEDNAEAQLQEQRTLE